MSQLQKARLFALDNNSFDFEFMFNPDVLSFKHAVKVKDAEGARTMQGTPKVSFEYPQARTLTLEKLMFDTYEDGSSVMEKYINQLVKSVKFWGFIQGTNSTSRPPIYMFVWGGQNYIRCFVETLSYKLTLFLPDGMPVRAEASLSLKEIDASNTQTGTRTYDPSQFGDRDKRTQPTQPVELNSDLPKRAQEKQKQCDQMRAEQKQLYEKSQQWWIYSAEQRQQFTQQAQQKGQQAQPVCDEATALTKISLQNSINNSG
ncbi:hypothetical protein GlitD10_2885 [Gloeomargarita lithophora Alchichica-D10]|uniref:Contractile injection system tube protein N-terminal domain-containing protein n=1 Tax=Gloeomargarita lithophora Alchichica-D10 TaxID=1188229 RepID=A0A1J0AH11_9CYAN|nr:hypothetical protein [Gloeomargarita lithophora]APB35230.1 hypothetical protein GlitD10_2885 [Gloeomargarita lithophora Alchichica-D10]